MGLVIFTATRSRMPEHPDGSSVALEIDFSGATRRRDVSKYPHRASAGSLETLYEGAETIWDVSLAPASGDQWARAREFLDSTADGQTFLIYLYGSEASPIQVKRQDGGYSPQPFQRIGSPVDDPQTASITVVEQ